MTPLTRDTDAGLRLRALLLSGLLALALTAVTLPLLDLVNPEPPAKVPSIMVDGSKAPDERDSADVEFGEKPAWTAESKELNRHLKNITEAQLADDSVVALGSSTGDYGYRLAVFDRGTGKHRWHIGGGDSLIDGAEVGFLGDLHVAGGLVFVEYKRTQGGYEQGIAALSLDAGAVEWMVTTDTAPRFEHHLS
ncbi:MAG: hypothetical protein ACRD0P_15565, partial [Stackebrandtia sp.]